MAATSKPVAYRIICRCVPSPQSMRKSSRSRRRAMLERFRPMVGWAAEVPRKVRRSIGSRD
jgi:hypothetical protein